MMLKHTLIAAVSAAGLLAGAGCQVITDPAAERFDNTPLVLDPAMQARADWPRQAVIYPNGSTVGWPMIYNHRTAPERPGYITSIWEMPLMFVQTLWAPVSALMDDPSQPRVYRGATFEPTFHAVPEPSGEQLQLHIVTQ